jgi:hypothetical protein
MSDDTVYVAVLLPHTLNFLSDLYNVYVAAGLPPTEWCKEIVYMIPKEAGVDVIEKQRPLGSCSRSRL